MNQSRVASPAAYQGGPAEAAQSHKPEPRRTKEITAQFTGSAGLESLGFERKKVYRLSITHNPAVEGYIIIKNQAEPKQECTYESLMAFLDNWDDINNVDD